MASEFLLDSDFCIAWMRGLPLAKSRIDETGWQRYAVCAIVRAELRVAYWKRPDEGSRQRLDWFLSVFPSLPFNDLAADEYGRQCAELERAGQMIGIKDLMIASIALSHGLTLVTRNLREFRRVPGLRVSEW